VTKRCGFAIGFLLPGTLRGSALPQQAGSAPLPLRETEGPIA